jgi:hypothetical protein
MATADHDRIEELLAAHALTSLSGEDAEHVDRLLLEHVPNCAACRDALADFQAVAGDLALSVPALAPPETLLPRLRREIERTPRAAPRRWSLPNAAAAASFVAFVAVTVVAVSLNDRVSRTEGERALVAQALTAASAAGAAPVGLLGGDGNRPDNAIAGIPAPPLERFTLVGHGVPAPRPGHVYRLWLGRGDAWEYQGEFVPDDGLVVVSFPVRDPSQYDRVLVTEEPDGLPPTQPASDWAWSSSLPP